jgi:hypothetical protein
MKYICYLLLLCFTLPVMAQDTTSYLEQKDIQYRTGETDAYMKERCRLDIYYPAKHADVPVIV